ncbi:MAG TPA: class I SAM-dependent methyltransferase [Pirellulales bacterium]|jgi:ubiquinone/menaquinone biosynthesis C-methylase UbiE|nr:class I SAM-dependent methyltransferase [Pirellulales bacterium]
MATATSELSRCSENDRAPAYADALKAFHEGFRAELTAIVDSLPLRDGMRVLDMACGDGFYASLLAPRVAPQGMVIGLDSSLPYLRHSREGSGSYVCGTLERFPLEAESFDFVWCAQSLYSLSEPVAALRRLRGALRPGGTIGVLENDSIHEVLLPWPSELELAVRQAERRALCNQSRRPEKFYVGRELSAVLAEAGFEPMSLRSQVIDRTTPLAPAEHYFMRNYLARLSQRVGPSLDDEHLTELRQLTDPQSPEYLLDRKHVTISWMNILALARRPAFGQRRGF